MISAAAMELTSDDPEENWTVFRDTVHSSAMDSLGPVSRKHQDWFVFLCISVLRVASGPRVKLASCKSALNTPPPPPDGLLYWPF